MGEGKGAVYFMHDIMQVLCHITFERANGERVKGAPDRDGQPMHQTGKRRQEARQATARLGKRDERGGGVGGDPEGQRGNDA
jgi:hypothetical protein